MILSQYILIILNNMKNLKTKTYVSFKIFTEDFTPVQISNLLWVKYDRAWEKWEKIISPKWEWNWMYYNFSCWIYDCKLNYLWDIDMLLENLLDIFLPLNDKITNLPNVELLFSWNIYFYNKMPSISFSTNLINKVWKLKANLNIELHDMKS